MTHLETLIDKATRGELLLLVGNDLPAALTGVPSGRELAQRLAQKWNAPAEPSLAAMADKLTSQQARHAQELLPAEGELAPLHRAIASLPIPYLMTAAYDDRLARALEDAGRPYNLLVENEDLDARKFNRTDLVKLCGDTGRHSPLILAKRQYNTLLNRPERSDLFNRWVNGWLGNKTVLMVGCDPAAVAGSRSDFYWLYWHVLRFRNAFTQGGFLVWQNPAGAEFWTKPQRQVTLLDEDPVPLLDQLAAGLVDQRIVLPPDKELASLKQMAQALAARPAAAQVAAEAARVSSSERVSLVRASLRLKLAPENDEPDALPTLRSRLDLATFPDIVALPVDEFRNTGITLDELLEWAEDAAIQRTKRNAFDQTVVEEAGITFFEKLLPAGSRARRAFELALFLDQTSADMFTVVLELDDEERRLSLIPWELLHAGMVNWEGVISGRGFLGRNYPIYRRLPGAADPARIAARIRRVLVIAADPTDKLTAALKEEVAWLEGVLPAGLHVDLYGPAEPIVSQPGQIKERLRDGDYQLFHFTGHALFDEGTPNDSKLLLGRPGDAEEHMLTAKELGELARQSPLTFVCLSACQGGEAAEKHDEERPWEELGVADALIDNGVPAVLGMRWNVGVDAALKMMKRFYQELFKGKPVEQALMLARGDVDADQPDWANPVLIKRHGVLDRGIGL